MVNYIIHVAFSRAAADTIERLTAELGKYRIGSGIKAEDGRGYVLPAGTYVYHGAEAVNEVRDAIVRIAGDIHTDGVSVLVTEVATASWAGLEELPAVPDEVSQ